VYSVDSDKLTALDMGPRRYPVFLAWEPAEHRQLAVQTERLRGVTEASRGGTGLGGGDGGDGKGEGKEGEEDVGSGFKSPAGAAGSDTNEEPDTEVATLFCTNNEVRLVVVLLLLGVMLLLGVIRQSGRCLACRPPTTALRHCLLCCGLFTVCALACSLRCSSPVAVPPFLSLILHPRSHTFSVPLLDL
jgi:hypothetical protein